MDTEAIANPEQFAFDRALLQPVADEHRDRYRSAHPFPHVVIDGFLPEHVVDGVLEEFPRPADVDWWAFDSDRERKLASRDDRVFGPRTSNLLAQFNAAPFLDFLEALTGIAGLVPDPHFHGGGLHQIEPGGYLKVHADFSHHPVTKLERRLNLLLYLNHDWHDEYGGALELWNRDMSACEARILPVFNRCVVFSTTDWSFHGHPEPLRCPEGRTRKSLALYYYTKERPPEERAAGRGHNTLFQPRPGEELRDSAGLATAQRRSPTKGPLASRFLHQVLPPVVADAAKRLRGNRGPRQGGR